VKVPTFWRIRTRQAVETVNFGLYTTRDNFEST